MSVKKLSKVFLLVLLIYVFYVCVTAVAIFYIPIEKEDNLKNVPSFLGKDSKDRVLLLENGYDSGIARIQMIKEAEQSIDIAYYSLGKGETTELFLGALLDAADRGVRIRVLLDGICHGLRGKMSDARYALASHKNIELRYYESINYLKPWTWHNRLHDKIMTVDQKLSIIGGRNIGDKYLAKKPPEDFVYDRDLLIYNAKQDTGSVIVQMHRYMSDLWSHPYTNKPYSDLSKRQKKKGKESSAALTTTYKNAVSEQREFVSSSINWEQSSVKANHVSFIHNPIERFHKQPIVWQTLSILAERAQKSVIIQSPYIIPTKPMKKVIPQKTNSSVEWTILTNSVKSTPNIMAFSGYLGTRDDIVQTGVKLYEYQKPYSIHGKSIVYDQNLSAVGSFNLDSRSAFLNTDSMVLIDSSAFADQLTNAIEKKITDNSILVAENKQYIESAEERKEKEPIIKGTFLHALSKITILWRRLI
ncbi:phospholipase D family protein [Peribacillus psychrosaccharolyticus]|uniref:phospholipase D-like domain-containing protein n=1 Tax=Peribacillus psychrosaccharolyticus TaxID=1407 RepID=UPI003D286810